MNSSASRLSIYILMLMVSLALAACGADKNLSTTSTSIAAETGSLPGDPGYVSGYQPGGQTPTEPILSQPTTTVTAGNAGAAGQLPTSTSTTGAPTSPTTVYQESDSGLSWTGTWSISESFRYEQGQAKVRLSQEMGASLTFTFSGTRCYMLAFQSDTAGVAKVTIDGRSPVEVDLFRHGAAVPIRARVWDSGALTDGIHTVTLSCTGQKNPASQGVAIVVDAVEIMGSVVM